MHPAPPRKHRHGQGDQRTWYVERGHQGMGGAGLQRGQQGCVQETEHLGRAGWVPSASRMETQGSVQACTGIACWSEEPVTRVTHVNVRASAMEQPRMTLVFPWTHIEILLIYLLIYLLNLRATCFTLPSARISGVHIQLTIYIYVSECVVSLCV